MDVHYKVKLVVTVCAIVYTSIAHQQLEEEVRWIDALGDDVVARGVLQTQPPTSPGVDRCSTYTPGAMLVSLICLLLGDYGASD